MKIILSHPIQFLQMLVIRAGWTLVGPGLSDWLYVFNLRQQNIDKTLDDKRDPLRLIKGPWLGIAGTFLLAGMLAGYWLLAVAGLITWRHEMVEGIILLLLLAAYYVLLPAVAGQGYSRFRHPIMPIVCVFAGKGLGTIADRYAVFKKDSRET